MLSINQNGVSSVSIQRGNPMVRLKTTSKCICVPSLPVPVTPHYLTPLLSLTHIHTPSLFKACPLYHSSAKEKKFCIILEQAQNAGRQQTNALDSEVFQVLFNSQVSSEETMSLLH